MAVIIGLSLGISLLTSVFSLPSLKGAQAGQSVLVSIDAPALVTQDSLFSATVNISGVTNLDAASYDIAFNSSVLEFKNVTSGAINGVEIPAVSNPRSPGLITVVNNINGVSGASGSGYLARLSFHVIGTSSQSSNITLSGGVLSSVNATAIPAEWAGTSVRVTSHQQATVSISAPPQVRRGGSFAIVVNISQVDNFDAANYDITFDPAVLSADNATAGKINGTDIPVVWNKTGGKISLVQHISGAQGVSGAGSLAVVNFSAIGSPGVSSGINLANGVLSDALALEIPAIWLGSRAMVLMFGDATNDGQVDARDITRVERIIASMDAPTLGGDANQDGKIDAIDITRVERIIARLD